MNQAMSGGRGEYRAHARDHAANGRANQAGGMASDVGATGGAGGTDASVRDMDVTGNTGDTGAAARNGDAAGASARDRKAEAGGAGVMGRPISDGAIDLSFLAAGDVVAASETVHVRLPHLENREDDRIEIGYNGRMYVLRRGVPVELPQPLYDVLRHADLV